MDPFIVFPSEIIEHILEYLFVDWQCVSSCRVVNKYYHEYITNWFTILLERELGADPRLDEGRKIDFTHTMYFVNGLSYLRNIKRPLALSINVKGVRKFGMRRFQADLPTLSNLVALRINGCPIFPSLSRLTKLEYMEILHPGSDFHVESLPSDIRTLIYAKSPYNESLHEALLKLTKLESLQLAYSGVRVRFMDQICKTLGTNLKSLGLIEDQSIMLIGIYDELTRLTNLEFLHVENSFYEENSDHLKIFGSLTKLTALGVRGCAHNHELDAPRYRHLSGLIRLEDLFFFPSHLNIRRFLPNITTLTNLKRLYMDASNLNDSDITPILSFKKLETIDFYYSQNFSSKISAIFNQLPALRRINIYSFQIPNEEVVLEDLSPLISVTKCTGSFGNDWFTRHSLI